jgi:hypothetical protein
LSVIATADTVVEFVTGSDSATGGLLASYGVNAIDCTRLISIFVAVPSVRVQVPIDVAAVLGHVHVTD